MKIKQNTTLLRKLNNLPFNEELIKRGCQIYAVGGAVRDQFIGKESKDLDIIICGIPLDQLSNVLEKHGKVNEVGKSFGIIKFTPFGETEEIDVAIPRTEKKLGIGYKGFEVYSDHNLTIEEDLFRRDFTMNSVALSLNGSYVDPFGGIEDINNGIIRLTNALAFAEDPLRMIRAISFASRFNFKIDDITMSMIRNFASKITEITPERILIEFEKIVSKGDMQLGTRLLHQSTIYSYIFNEKASIDNMYDIDFSENRMSLAKTMGEFVFLLTHDLISNPAKFYKENLKGEIGTTKEIEALSFIENVKFFINDEEKKMKLFEMLKIYPSAINSQILRTDFLTLLKEFKNGNYPISLKELQIDGNDLIKRGFQGKKIKEIQYIVLSEIFRDGIKNDKAEILNFINSL